MGRARLAIVNSLRVLMIHISLDSLVRIPPAQRCLAAHSTVRPADGNVPGPAHEALRGDPVQFALDQHLLAAGSSLNLPDQTNSADAERTAIPNASGCQGAGRMRALEHPAGIGTTMTHAATRVASSLSRCVQPTSPSRTHSYSRSSECSDSAIPAGSPLGEDTAGMRDKFERHLGHRHSGLPGARGLSFRGAIDSLSKPPCANTSAILG